MREKDLPLRPRKDECGLAFCHPLQHQKGIVAEWLGTGLQNLLQRFESARYLRKYFKPP